MGDFKIKIEGLDKKMSGWSLLETSGQIAEKIRKYMLIRTLASAVTKGRGKGTKNFVTKAPLAFLSPRIIAAIVDGTAPADLTVTGLAEALPYSWAEQEQSIGL
jgi:hypothetical protein